MREGQEDETQEQGKTTRWRHGAGYLQQKRDNINMTGNRWIQEQREAGQSESKEEVGPPR